MKILVLGSNGMIGHRVLLEARKQFGENVYGLMRRSKSEFSSYSYLQKNIFENVDVSNWENVEEILNQVMPGVVINAVGVTLRRERVNDLNYALDLNSFFPQRLAKWVQKNNSRLIHFSTDCVFKGDSGNYTEYSTPSATDNYGRSKFLGEVDGQNCLTLRFSCIGQELDVRSELLEWFLAQSNNVIKGYSNVMYSGVTTLVVARETCRLISDFKDLTGVVQVSSKPISKYELLILAKKYFKMNVEILPYHDYISDKSLDSTFYQKITGYQPIDWEVMMAELANDNGVKYIRN